MATTGHSTSTPTPTSASTPMSMPVPASLPPGSRLPVTIQTLLTWSRRDRMYRHWQRRYGDVFTLRIAPAGTAVALAGPEDIEAVFAGSPSTFHAGEGNAILKPVMGDRSVLLLDEGDHLAMRRRLAPAFSGQAVRRYADLVNELAAAELRRWPVDRPFALHPKMHRLTLEIILRVVFGVSDEARLARLRPLLARVVSANLVIMAGTAFPRIPEVGPWRRYRRLLEWTDEALYAEIADRRQVADLGGRSDVLSRLLSADRAGRGEPLSDQELRDQLMTLLLAGHETTATSLAWAFHELSHRPDQLAAAQRAADDDDDAYLTAVVKEAMRLRPVIWQVARRLTRPVEVAGYHLPAGIVVLPTIGLVHRNPREFADPNDFKPQRFLGGQPDPGTWIPFGGGVRRCLGASLSLMESTAVLGAVLSSLDLRPASSRPEQARPRNITLVPARGARVIVHPRRTAP